MGGIHISELLRALFQVLFVGSIVKEVEQEHHRQRQNLPCEVQEENQGGITLRQGVLQTTEKVIVPVLVQVQTCPVRVRYREEQQHQ